MQYTCYKAAHCVMSHPLEAGVAIVFNNTAFKDTLRTPATPLALPLFK